MKLETTEDSPKPGYRFPFALARERYSRSFGLFIFPFIVAAFLSLWNTLATQDFSLKICTAFFVMCGMVSIYGHLAARLIPATHSTRAGPAVRFLCGYFALNTLAFVLVFITHFTTVGIILILAGAGLLALLFWPKRTGDSHQDDDWAPDILCLLVCGIGATLWCADSLNPIVESRRVIFQMWPECFFHAREISILAQAHGAGTISDIQMSGTPTVIYHLAGYVMPAAIVSATHATALEMFGGFYLPFGILLSGLAAFALTSAIWSKWPGIAGAVAVVLLPDAYEQGFQNKFMGYHFLQQVNPGGLYGVALLALAWMFMQEGTKSGKWPAVLFAYALAAASVAYKAQLFVANAFLIMIYPCFFFTGMKLRWRLFAMSGLTVLFYSVVILSQHSSAVPTLRLDGSGAMRYARVIISTYDTGWFKSFYYHALPGLPTVPFHLGVASMVAISSFGVWMVLLLAAFIFQRSRLHFSAWLFPLLVIVNYLVMSVGLASDDKKVGMPEELQHRPLVWAYFVAAAWTTAAAYAWLAGNKPPGKPAARILTGCFILGSMLAPIAFAHGIQTINVWQGCGNYETLDSYPPGFVKACLFIRMQSKPGDIVQDSENDGRYLLAGLGERQDFAVESKSSYKTRTPNGLYERLTHLESFRNMTNETDIIDFANKNGVSWYLLEPKTHVNWPSSLLEKPAFNSDGYRVYHFPGL